MENKTKHQLLKDYLLKSIDFSGYDDHRRNTIEGLFSQCKIEYGHISDDYRRIHEWLLGLPSCLNIVYSYYDIKELMQSFGYKQDNQFKLNDTYRHNLAKIIVNNK